MLSVLFCSVLFYSILFYVASEGGLLQTAGSQTFFKGTLVTDSYQPNPPVSQVLLMGQESPLLQATNNSSRQISHIAFQTLSEGSQGKGSTSTQTAAVHLCVLPHGFSSKRETACSLCLQPRSCL